MKINGFESSRRVLSLLKGLFRRKSSIFLSLLKGLFRRQSSILFCWPKTKNVFIGVDLFYRFYPANMQDRANVGHQLAELAKLGQIFQRFANVANVLPTFLQNCNYCSSKFPRIFSRSFNDSSPFSFTYRYLICQKYFFLSRFSQRW